MVLKPRHGSGGRGVVVLSSAADWPAAVDGLDATYGDGVLVQSFIGGLPLGLDGAVKGGEVFLTLIREKVVTPPPSRVELAFRGPARLPPAAQASIVDTLQRAVDALGVDGAVFHADGIWTSGGDFVLIELSARPAGLVITSRLVPACTGVDFLAEAIRLQVDGTGRFEPAFLCPTLLHYWSHPSGVVRRVPPAAALLALPHVIAVEVGLREGQRLETPRSLDDVIDNGYVLACGDLWAEVEAARDEAESRFAIEPRRSAA
jgi:hypothetical protein